MTDGGRLGTGGIELDEGVCGNWPKSVIEGLRPFEDEMVGGSARFDERILVAIFGRPVAVAKATCSFQSFGEVADSLNRVEDSDGAREVLEEACMVFLADSA